MYVIVISVMNFLHYELHYNNGEVLYVVRKGAKAALFFLLHAT